MIPRACFVARASSSALALRFADDTLHLIPPALPALDQVSGDRLRHELELIFGEAQPLKPLLRLHELGILRRSIRRSSSTSGSPRVSKRRPRPSIASPAGPG